MWLWDFPDAGKTRAWVSMVCKGAWLLLRSEFHDTMLYEAPAQGQPYIVAAIPLQIFLLLNKRVDAYKIFYIHLHGKF